MIFRWHASMGSRTAHQKLQKFTPFHVIFWPFLHLWSQNLPCITPPLCPNYAISEVLQGIFSAGIDWRESQMSLAVASHWKILIHWVRRKNDFYHTSAVSFLQDLCAAVTLWLLISILLHWDYFSCHYGLQNNVLFKTKCQVINCLCE